MPERLKMPCVYPGPGGERCCECHACQGDAVWRTDLLIAEAERDDLRRENERLRGLIDHLYRFRHGQWLTVRTEIERAHRQAHGQDTP